MTAVRQVVGTWIAGSAVTGTLAVIFTRGIAEPEIWPLKALEPAARLAVFLLVGALFLVLLALGWRTQGESWLPDGGRGALLWAILVTGGGFLGWGYAAVITFAGGFSRDAQLVLAFTCGGLPFALIAAMLLRPVRVNLAAGALSVVAFAIGWLVAGENRIGGNPLELCAWYVWWMFSPDFRAL